MSLPNPKFLSFLGESTSEILRAFPRTTEFAGLDRDVKGFWYEMFVQSLLDVNNVSCVGNPSSYEAWNENQIEGYDIKIRFPNGETKRVECKLTLKHLYPCWIERDWLSRTADIIVTNDVYAVPYRERRLLSKQGKKLMSTTEFMMYVQKRMKRGNQYLYWNCIRKYLLNCFRSSSVLFEPLKYQNDKPRVEDLLGFIVKKQGLPASHLTEIREPKSIRHDLKGASFCRL